MLGYIVVRTGQRNARLGGQDAGCPDAIVTRPEWGAMWLGIETKYGKGRLSPAQKALNDLGCTRVIRSVEQALAALEAVGLTTSGGQE